MIRCAICGEAAGSTGSLSGLVHKYGPTDHPFTPARAGTKRNIERYYRVIIRSLFYIDGNLDYERITAAITRLANAVNTYNGDDWFYIGEFEPADVTEVIIGAYWHYAEYHAGMDSPEYAAMSALANIFAPGISGPEVGNEAYKALNDLATSAFVADARY